MTGTLHGQPRANAVLLAEVIQGEFPGLGMLQTLRVAEHVPVTNANILLIGETTEAATPSGHIVDTQLNADSYSTYSPARDREAATVILFSIFTKPRAFALLERTRDTKT